MHMYIKYMQTVLADSTCRQYLSAAVSSYAVQVPAEIETMKPASMALSKASSDCVHNI